MAKMTEKQINILSIVGGILVFALFAFLSYMDYEEIDQVKIQQDGVLQEINQAKTKKAQLTALKSQLYVLKENYEFVKQMLPDDREILKFYETLDQFRINKQMQAWDTFAAESGPNINTRELNKKKGTQPQLPASLISTSYNAVIPATYNQLGELLTAIEAYPRFYGVTSIALPDMTSSPTSPEPTGTVALNLISFTYPPKSPFDEKEIKRLLNDFKVTQKEQKQIQEIKDKWKKTPFQWSPLTRNPFDKDKVLVPIKSHEAVGPDVVRPLQPEMGPDEAQKLVDELEKLRNQHLLPFAVAGLWVELQSKLMEQKYEEKLNSLVLPAETQPQYIQKLEDMKRELREWKNQIKQVALEQKARQFLTYGEKKIKEMDNFYQEGKEKGAKDIIDNVIKIYNELLPQIREYEPLENKIPQLQTQRKRAEELYNKADTQIKIIEEVAKLELQGVIYWANKPQYSVAFINKKVVRKDDMVAGGFIVHDIKDGEVILRYQSETVPIRLKRVIKASALIKKSS
jgi:Tfp pilus assembly protein PilO